MALKEQRANAREDRRLRDNTTRPRVHFTFGARSVRWSNPGGPALATTVVGVHEGKVHIFGGPIPGQSASPGDMTNSPIAVISTDYQGFICSVAMDIDNRWWDMESGTLLDGVPNKEWVNERLSAHGIAERFGPNWRLIPQAP